MRDLKHYEYFNLTYLPVLLTIAWRLLQNLLFDKLLLSHSHPTMEEG